jgi:hypothetical protein
LWFCAQLIKLNIFPQMEAFFKKQSKPVVQEDVVMEESKLMEQA